MKIERTVTEKVIDSRGNEIRKGDLLLYRRKSDEECIGRFEGLEKGLLCMTTLTKNKVYYLRPANIGFCVVYGSSADDVAKGQGQQAE